MTKKTTKALLLIAVTLLLIAVGAATRFYLAPSTSQNPAIGNPVAKSAPIAADQRTALPEFQLADIEGKPRDITEWQGKVVVLNFWATWCPPCRRELPTFKALQNEYGTQGVQFIGISLDRDELVRDYARIEELNYPQLVGPSKALELSQLLGNKIGALPFTVVVDREGRIAERIFGEWSHDEAITTFKRLL
ncbi:MAG: TlpA family protein disulfide reductase [Proteobacteria bacterium]|nr:MAG: TlpA family protein disulfide reductase [Pseudomonadota bacterium]QKK10252.1 MAG: TlpA family protein disulfide reductase [Pseudomonadota bacterium]